MSTSVHSYAKINLGLAIGPPRPDGFHSLTTLYQTIALADIVTVSVRSAQPAAKNGNFEQNTPPNNINSKSDNINSISNNITHSSINIKTTSNHPKVPLDETNTAVRILKLALEKMQIFSAEIDLHIQKNLPVQGGLGAGSANAAAALIALEAELNQSLPASDRLALAALIGSDVPLFLLGGTVLGLNRGEEVYPLPDLPQMPCIIVVPPTGVSTPQAFRDWDALPQNAATPDLTASNDSDRLKELSRVLASAFAPSIASGVLQNSQDLAENPLLALVRTGIENDFESVVFPVYPSLCALKRLLAGSNSGDGEAVYAALSGSGSALFGLYRNTADAEAAQQRVLQYAAAELPGTEVLLTTTLPRGAYWKQMLQR